MKIPRTTLCYISDGNEWLFIHKKRKNDPNKDKYLGIGGHIEEGETNEECIVREIYEETGIIASESLSNLNQLGVVNFYSDKYGYEEMNVFTADFNGERKQIISECNEGELKWIDKKEAYNLPIWEGDKLIFDMLLEGTKFEMTLCYEGEKLMSKEIKKL